MDIKGGSEKQNAWATQIATGWVSCIDDEIRTSELRIANEAEHKDWAAKLTELVAALKSQREHAVKALSGMSAKTIIDNRSRDLGREWVKAVHGKIFGESR